MGAKMSQFSIEDRLTIIREKRGERDQLLQRVADLNDVIKHETELLAESVERVASDLKEVV